MMPTRLSFVVLTWNEEANIAACLESIAAQSTHGLEIIIIDAGSTDGTLAEIERVRKTIQVPLRVHVGPRRMPIGQARNLGVTMAQAPSVAFLSADAELARGWATRALRNLQVADMVFGKQQHAPLAWSLAGAIRGLRYRFPDHAPKDPLEFASNVAAAYSKRLLVESPFDDWANAAEDLLLARRAAANGHRAAYDPKLIVRHHDVSTLRQEMRKNLREGRGCGLYAGELGVQWPVLAWLGLITVAASVAFIHVAIALVALAAVLWLPALRRAVRRRHEMPLGSLVAGTIASPPFDLAFMMQYVRGLLAARPTAGGPADEQGIPSMRHTLRDTPEIVDRIGRDLAVCVDAVRQGDPHLRALVLTGGFARGEGTFLDGDPQNDYDLIAIRGPGRPRTSYKAIRKGLEERLGMHIDLAAVPAWRLPLAEPSIFWYETALRGVTLWGEELRPRIRTHHPSQLRKTEALRLLVNRSAGLLLATGTNDANAVRIQASKALLAAYDVRLLATGTFPPSQKERWEHPVHVLVAQELGPVAASWCAWAYAFKTDPANAPACATDDAWRAARDAILGAVPVALRHAGLSSLAAYGRRDSMVGRIVYALRAHRVRGAKRFLLNPTGGIRLATLSMLHVTTERRLHDTEAAGCLASVCVPQTDPLETLMRLREASLQ